MDIIDNTFDEITIFHEKLTKLKENLLSDDNHSELLDKLSKYNNRFINVLQEVNNEILNDRDYKLSKEKRLNIYELRKKLSKFAMNQYYTDMKRNDDYYVKILNEKEFQVMISFQHTTKLIYEFVDDNTVFLKSIENWNNSMSGNNLKTVDVDFKKTIIDIDSIIVDVNKYFK